MRANITRSPLSLGALSLIVAMITLAEAGPANAAVLPVTKLADTLDGACNADCSLREAIQQANGDGTEDVITLPPGNFRVDLAGGAPEEANASGDLDVSQDLVIRGAGADATTIQSFLPIPPSASTDRVLDLRGSSSSLLLTDASIVGGISSDSSVGLGGGIRSAAAGTLTLERVVVRGNAVQGVTAYGGGIYKSTGALIARDSSIHENRATGLGYGGGIFLNALSTTAELTNVTLTGNSADQSGGAIYSNNAIVAHLVNVTVAANNASMKGGLGGDVSELRLRSSIVAGNTGPGGTDNCAAPYAPASDGGNVGDPACGLTQPTDAQTLDAELGPFGGAPIPVFEPLTTSPALDRAVGDCPASDARGVKRPQGAACDSGAAERPVAVTIDNVLPVGSQLAFARRSFAAETKGASTTRRKKRKKKAKRGSRVTYKLSETALTTFTVERATKGRKVGKACKRKTTKNRKRRKCTLYKAVKGSFAHSGNSGSNSFTFRGRIAGKSLRRGNYRLVGVPRDAAGNVGKPFRASFKVVKR
jgi:CSLREA domain-containing protein